MSEVPALTTPLPSKQDLENFDERMETFMQELPGFGSGMNGLRAEILNLFQNFGFASTSVTENTVDTSGPKTFIVQPDLSYAGGQFVIAASTASPINYIVGQVSSYDVETGELVISADNAAGAGTFADWSLSITLAVAESAFITSEANRAEAAAISAAESENASSAGDQVYNTTADALSKGVYSLDSLITGSGGADGTFALGFSDGGGTGVAGWFTVVDGAISAYGITAHGRGYTSAPTVSFAESAGLTGASATAVITQNRPHGTFFWVPVSTGAAMARRYKNESDVAVTDDNWLLVSAAYIASILQTNGAKDVVRLLAGDGKAALRVTRMGRLIVAGKDISSLADAAGQLAQLIARSENQNAATVRVLDSKGKEPLRINRHGRILLWGRDVLTELDSLGEDLQPQVDVINARLTPSVDITFIGDSLTAYAGSWAKTMLDADSPLSNKNRGSTFVTVGGMGSSQLAGRLGALPFLLTFENNKILAAGPSAVLASEMISPDGSTPYTVYPISNQGGPLIVTVAGITGELSSATFTDAIPDSLIFTPSTYPVANVDVDSGVPAISVAAIGSDYSILALLVGRNNYSEVATVKRDWLAIRDWQKTLDRRVIVVTPPNKAGEGIVSGAEAYAKFVDLERYAQYVFGDCAVISRQILMRYGNGGGADNEAIADGRVPPSLSSDGVHWLTGEGSGHQIIRNFVSNLINRKGY